MLHTVVQGLEREVKHLGLPARLATSIRELCASLTAGSVAKAAATSGVSNIKFMPSQYDFKYFPRTPLPSSSRLYSDRSSSGLPFLINLFPTTSGGALLDAAVTAESREVPKFLH
jgi:hypothetical protein